MRRTKFAVERIIKKFLPKKKWKNDRYSVDLIFENRYYNIRRIFTIEKTEPKS